MNYTRIEIYDKLMNLLEKHKENVIAKRDKDTRYDMFYSNNEYGVKKYTIFLSYGEAETLMLDDMKTPVRAIIYTELDRETINNFFKQFEKVVWNE